MSILGETLDRLLERKPRPVRAVHQKASVCRAVSHLAKPLRHSFAKGRGTLFLSPPTRPEGTHSTTERGRSSRAARRERSVSHTVTTAMNEIFISRQHGAGMSQAAAGRSPQPARSLGAGPGAGAHPSPPAAASPPAALQRPQPDGRQGRARTLPPHPPPARLPAGGGRRK